MQAAKALGSLSRLIRAFTAYLYNKYQNIMLLVQILYLSLISDTFTTHNISNSNKSILFVLLLYVPVNTQQLW